VLWIPAFAGMTERETEMTKETDGLDKSSPYIERQDACSTLLFILLRAYSNTPLLLSVNLQPLF